MPQHGGEEVHELVHRADVARAVLPKGVGCSGRERLDRPVGGHHGALGSEAGGVSCRHDEAGGRDGPLAAGSQRQTRLGPDDLGRDLPRDPRGCERGAAPHGEAGPEVVEVDTGARPRPRAVEADPRASGAGERDRNGADDAGTGRVGRDPVADVGEQGDAAVVRVGGADAHEAVVSGGCERCREEACPGGVVSGARDDDDPFRGELCEEVVQGGVVGLLRGLVVVAEREVDDVEDAVRDRVPGLLGRLRSAVPLEEQAQCGDDVVLQGRSVGRHDRHREDDGLGAALADHPGDERPVAAQDVEEPVDVVDDDSGVLGVARRLSPHADGLAADRDTPVRTRTRGRVGALLGRRNVLLAGAPLVGEPGVHAQPGVEDRDDGGCRGGHGRGPGVRRGPHDGSAASDAGGAVLGEAATAPDAAATAPDAAATAPDAAAAAPDAAAAAPDAATGSQDVLDGHTGGHAATASVTPFQALLFALGQRVALGRVGSRPSPSLS